MKSQSYDGFAVLPERLVQRSGARCTCEGRAWVGLCKTVAMSEKSGCLGFSDTAVVFGSFSSVVECSLRSER